MSDEIKPTTGHLAINVLMGSHLLIYQITIEKQSLQFVGIGFGGLPSVHVL